MENKNKYGGASFSLKNRIFRAIWGVFYFFLFKFTPRPFHIWRRLILRLFGAKIGQGCHVYPGVKIWAPWNLVLGDFVGIGDGATIYSMDLIRIGDYSVVSQGVHLCAGSHDFNAENFQLITSPITIGQHVWLCAEVFVGLGVSISDGSVVGARGVVTKSITDSWLVWGGVPVNKIGERDKKRVLNTVDEK
ncbi:Acetyltransferase [hydrothermal vent metagenome]|uniref:Acetyltransferase n=1 Tax=hydrothermal vent metagenome TaxID=652676 RepID=A0A3B0YN86_9ZZZZ